MPDPLALTVLIIVSMLVFTIAGVVGFGGGIAILPLLVWFFGPRDAVLIIAIVQSLSIVARASLNIREVSWPVAKWFALGALPVSAMGAFLFVITPPDILVRLLGCLLILLVIHRHTRWGREWVFGLKGFSAVGAVSGFSSGFLGTPGPIAAPFILSHGLSGRAYVGTFGACLLFTQVPKMVVFATSNLFIPQVLWFGFGIGAIALVGAFLGRLIIPKVPQRWVELAVDALMVTGGVLLLARG